MPRFPSYERRQGLDVGPAVQARAVESVNPLAPALDAGARSAFRIGDAVERVEEQDARAEFAATMADGRLHWTKRRIELEQSAAPGAPEFAPKLQAEFDAWRQEKLAGLKSDRAREMVTFGLQDMEGDLVGRGMEFEARSRIAHRTQLLGEAADKAATAAFLDPGSAQAILVEQRAAILGDEGLPEATRRELAGKVDQAVAESAFRAIVERDPHGAAQRLQADDPIANLLDPRVRAGLTNQAQTEVKRRVAEAKAEARAAEFERRQAQVAAQAEMQADIATRAEDSIALAAAGQPVQKPLLEADFIAAYGEKRGPQLWQRFDRQAQTADALGQVFGAPLDQQDEMLARLSPDPTKAGFAEDQERVGRVAQAIAADREARLADPAGYVKRAVPGVADAFAQAASGDPTALRYATAKSIAAQVEMGVPEAAIRPFDAPTLAALANGVMSDGDPRAQVERLSQVAGLLTDPRRRAQLLTDLEKAGLPEGASLVAARAAEKDPDAVSAAARVWRDLQAGKVDLPTAVDRPTFVAAMDSAAGSLDQSAGLIATWTGDGSAVGRAQSMRATLERVAKVRTAASGDASDAAASAARDLLGGVRYVARDEIVAGEVPAAYNEDVLASRLEQARATVTLSADDLKASLKHLALDGQNPERLAELITEDVRENARWIAHGTTATLMVPVPDGTTATMRPLRRADGSAWTVDLAALMRAPAARGEGVDSSRWMPSWGPSG